jgi:hypothetical protein
MTGEALLLGWKGRNPKRGQGNVMPQQHRATMACWHASGSRESIDDGAVAAPPIRQVDRLAIALASVLLGREAECFAFCGPGFVAYIACRDISKRGHRDQRWPETRLAWDAAYRLIG